MNKLFLDTSAWVEYLGGTFKGQKVRELVLSNISLTSAMVAAELLAKYIKESQPIYPVESSLQQATFIDMNFILGKLTAQIYIEQRKKKPKFGLIDAHIVAAARLNNAQLVTCDHDFSGFKEAIIIK